MSKKRCKKCKCSLENGYYGEKRRRLFRYKWTYWCINCYRLRFINMVEANPLVLAEYYNTYGKDPREVIKLRQF